MSSELYGCLGVIERLFLLVLSGMLGVIIVSLMSRFGMLMKSIVQERITGVRILYVIGLRIGPYS